MRRPTAQAHQILTDATTIATLIAPALANLDLGLAGWPSTTPGASPAEGSGSSECPRRDCTNERPCVTHGDDVQLTSTERLGLAPDKARADLDALLEAVRAMAHQGAIAAVICARWGYAGLNQTDVKQRLLTIDAQIWCAHCSKFGRHEPRAKDRPNCEWCTQFLARYKRLPPREVWDARDARNGRIDETTIGRLLKQVEAERKAAQAAVKAKQRAEAEAG